MGLDTMGNMFAPARLQLTRMHCRSSVGSHLDTQPTWREIWTA